MKFLPIHDFGKCFRVRGIHFFYHPLRFVQIRLAVGMLVLAAHGFYIIISLFRQQHIICLKQVFIVFPMEYGFFFLVYIFCMNTLAKVSSVMAETDIFTVQIFPCPVKSCQLAVTRILRGNMVSRIIRKISQRFFPFRPHMKRYIYIVIGHPVFFMGRHEYLDIHFIFPSLP